MKKPKPPVLSKEISGTIIVIPASIGLETPIMDARLYPGQRKQVFGSLKQLAEQCGAGITTAGEEFQVSGSRESLQAFVGFIHWSGTPYRLATRAG